MITIILADDHLLVRECLKQLLTDEATVQIVGEAADGITTVALVRKLNPKILLLDLSMPGLNGLEVLLELKNHQTKVLIVSMHGDQGRVLEALKRGAAGYILKDSTATELIEAIQTVAGGNIFISSSLRNACSNSVFKARISALGNISSNLTGREKEILKRAAEGETATEIAGKLLISARTVESHRSSLMKKLGLKSQTDLIRYAVREHISPI
jgi:two-component system response regulator NreC